MSQKSVFLRLPLVERIFKQHRFIPKEYLDFLADLSKITSISGYLMITTPKVLEVLEALLNETIEIFSVNQKESLDLLGREIPGAWKTWYNILKLENAKHFNIETKKIIQKLCTMRREIFENAAERVTTDYFKWEGGEHETQCYPLWDLLYHPSSYQIGKNKNRNEEEKCQKKIPGKDRKFAYGVFSVGCACSKNITYG